MTRLRAPKGACVVRAYRHGLGDCFLIAFANMANHQKYVLVDCGVLLGTKNAEKVMVDVAKNIKEATGNRLHALVLTHQHWDHISGFGQAAEVFDEMRVDQLWVSWAENAEDPMAKELLERYGAGRSGLRLALGSLAGHKSPRAKYTQDVMRFLGPLGAAERLTTDSIMKRMLERFTDSTRFCTPGDAPHQIPGLPQVSFFVLGPPRDISLIRKSRPSRGDVYLTDFDSSEFDVLMQALDSQGGRSGATGRHQRSWQPFSEDYIESTSDVAAIMESAGLAECKKLYRQEDWRGIDDLWLNRVGDFAIRLDSHLNNTSLVLAIELEPNGAVMLFPGDAQVGNWRSWHSVKWAEREHVTASDLLQRTGFYKVGHHASHNATLGDQGLELMTSEKLRAVIPLDRKVAKKMRWAMPEQKLYRRLKERTDNRTYVTDEARKPAFAARSTPLFADFPVRGS